jgi:hypothetical protein
MARARFRSIPLLAPATLAAFLLWGEEAAAQRPGWCLGPFVITHSECYDPPRTPTLCERLEEAIADKERLRECFAANTSAQEARACVAEAFQGEDVTLAEGGHTAGRGEQAKGYCVDHCANGSRPFCEILNAACDAHEQTHVSQERSSPRPPDPPKPPDRSAYGDREMDYRRDLREWQQAMENWRQEWEEAYREFAEEGEYNRREASGYDAEIDYLRERLAEVRGSC